jgi:hypothetical protein
VLEGGGGGLGGGESLGELSDEGVRVEGVEEVDVTGGAGEDCKNESVSKVGDGGKGAEDVPVKGSLPSVT